ncbi:28S ribosomal protein S9, mitochondrial [Biomphalaria glabrata]|nr:28S ribosomal protein S9, mitochondrial [Biomphalaria glabrata]
MESTKSLAVAFILSRLDYCNAMLAGIPDDKIANLQRIQNNAARIVLRKTRRDSATTLLRTLHWLPLKRALCSMDSTLLVVPRFSLKSYGLLAFSVHGPKVTTISSDLVNGGNQSVTKSDNQPSAKAITISRSMKAYMEKVKKHDELMKTEVADYEIGKRHLANIMGADPDTFTQEDVDRAIEYLLPNGLFDKKARPMLKNPYEIYPKRKAAEFTFEGRPFHWLYFTTSPNYYNILYDITWKLEGLKTLEDQLYNAKKDISSESKPLNIASSEWITFDQLKNKVLEKIQEKDYQHFIVMMERLASHPLASKEEEFIMQYRNKLHLASAALIAHPVETDADGRSFSWAEGRRKDSWAQVKVYKPGTGQVTINEKDLSYFSNLLYRETLLFPLSVTGLLGQVDIVADAKYGGPTGQAGAIRFALSQALCAFVSDDIKEQLRLSGMLTRDPRKRERKKPGQEGARKKFTWKKR